MWKNKVIFPHTHFIYASNEPKSVLARDLGDCRDNLRNSRSVFLIVYASNEPKTVPAQDLGVAKRQWRLFSNDRNGV